MKSSLMLFILCSIFSSELLSKTSPLVTVYNDDKKERNLYQILSVETADNGNEEILSFHQDTFNISTNQLVERISFSKNELAVGYPLREEKGFKILVIKSASMNDVLGGKISLRFLKNGATKKYRTHELEVVRNGDFWYVIDPTGSFTNKADITVNYKKIIGKVGIKKIEYSTL